MRPPPPPPHEVKRSKQNDRKQRAQTARYVLAPHKPSVIQNPLLTERSDPSPDLLSQGKSDVNFRGIAH
jgi:hypothetical protein